MKNIINMFKKANLRAKTHLVSSIFAGIVISICLLEVIMPQAIGADYTNASNVLAVCPVKSSPSGSGTITPTWTTRQFSWVKTTIKVLVTAYSSTPEQTDDTPFITASGKNVKDGIIANNMLPFGTRIRIPELYGYKVFTVEDRMNRNNSNYHIDIWMPDKPSAVNFGVKTVNIEVLES